MSFGCGANCWRVGATTLVMAECARACANTFFPTRPVAPNNSIFIVELSFYFTIAFTSNRRHAASGRNRFIQKNGPGLAR
jgi:hypothetical protein